jgi:serine protease
MFNRTFTTIVATAMAASAIMATSVASAKAAPPPPTPGGDGPDLAKIDSRGTGPVAAPGEKTDGRAKLPSHVPFDVREKRGQDEENGASTASLTSSLTYGTGYTQTSPRIYLVLWGDWQTTRGDPYHVSGTLWNFYAGIGGSGWNNTQTQYGYSCGFGALGCSTGVRIQNTANQAKYWIYDTSFVPTNPTPDQMAAEAQKAAQYFGDRSINAQYVIALATGHRDQYDIANRYCASHQYTYSNGNPISYTNMPYLPDQGTTCGAFKVNTTAAGILDGVTILAGHEYAESETDPFLNAWLDSDKNENSDKCLQWSLPGYFRNLTFSTGTFVVQPLWSNYAFQTTGNGCVFWS